MSEILPEGATCASHPETPASWTCARCGSFMCPDCERRTRPEARPMCPACWDLRFKRVEPNQGRSSGTALQTEAETVATLVFELVQTMVRFVAAAALASSRTAVACVVCVG